MTLTVKDVSYKDIYRITLPSIVSQSSSTIMGMINLLIIAQLGTAAIGAINITNVIMLNMTSLFGAIVHTMNYMIAQNSTEEKRENAIKIMSNSVIYVLFIAAISLIIMLSASNWIFRLMEASVEVTSLGENYLKIRAVAFAIQLSRLILVGNFRGTGDTKTTMYAGILSCIVTLITSYLFVHILNFGIIGAGMAILIAEIFQFLYLYFIFKKNRGYLLFDRSMVENSMFGKITIETLKLGIQDFGMTFSLVFFTIFATRLGDYELAATGIIQNIVSFAYLPGIAFGITATTLMGKEFSNTNTENQSLKLGINKLLNKLMIGTLTILLPICIILFVFNFNISYYYTKELEFEVLELVRYGLIISSIFLSFDALQLTLTGVIRGFGDTSFLLFSALVCAWLFFIPICYIMTFVMDLGYKGMWLSFYLYIVLLFIVYLLRSKYLIKNIESL